MTCYRAMTSLPGSALPCIFYSRFLQRVGFWRQRNYAFQLPFTHAKRNRQTIRFVKRLGNGEVRNKGRENSHVPRRLDDGDLVEEVPNAKQEINQRQAEDCGQLSQAAKETWMRTHTRGTDQPNSV